jgi:hypothetical protein
LTFSEYINKSVSDSRILAQVDISSPNAQWINCGAGIWYCNFDGLYPEVDPLLLEGFTAQTQFTDIGSVLVDNIFQASTASLSALTGNSGYYYFDSVANSLYVCLPNFDEPWLHTITLGVIHGFSFDEFIPVGAASLYEGRLLGNPSVSQSRDPLFWGKLSYDFGGIELINSDAEYDTFAETNDVYGNEARIYFGYKQLNISDYARIYTGAIKTISVSEESMSIGLSDKRAQLTASIQYSCTSKNALDAIVEILSLAYNIQYNDIYYNTTNWTAARALVPVITIDMQDEGSVIDIIEDICASVFGLFLIESDNRFSFKIIDTSVSAETTIVHADILNSHEVSYDPSEVISSVKVGYNKDWDSDYVSPYTWYTDTSQESAIYLKYKTYNQGEYFTLLTNLTDATAFGTKILNYAKDVHGTGQITTGMKYYSYGVGSIVDIEIWREKQSMLGTKKCEIISKQYNLREASITFGYRIV